MLSSCNIILVGGTALNTYCLCGHNTPQALQKKRGVNVTAASSHIRYIRAPQAESECTEDLLTDIANVPVSTATTLENGGQGPQKEDVFWRELVCRTIAHTEVHSSYS